MAQMIVRDLDDEVRDRLRERARAHGRSMEAEAREILRAAVMSGSNDAGHGLGTRISELFADVGFDGELSRAPAQAARPARLDE